MGEAEEEMGEAEEEMGEAEEEMGEAEEEMGGAEEMREVTEAEERPMDERRSRFPALMHCRA